MIFQLPLKTTLRYQNLKNLTNLIVYYTLLSLLYHLRLFLIEIEVNYEYFIRRLNNCSELEELLSSIGERVLKCGT